MQADLHGEGPLWAPWGRPVLVAKALAGSGTGAVAKVWFGRGRMGSGAWMLAACFDIVCVFVPDSPARLAAPLQHADAHLVADDPRSTVLPESNERL